MAEHPMAGARSERQSPRDAAVTLPPGQHVSRRWPVIHVGAVPQIDLEGWRLEVTGEVRSPVRLTWEDVLGLPSAEIEFDAHCVTRWSRLGMRCRGVHWRELARLTRPTPEAKFILAHAHEYSYSANLPITAVEDDRALIAYEIEGEPLDPEHGWPLRLLVPDRYFWKSVKWLQRIELLKEDRPGLWEGRGYHNEADPWKSQRSTSGRVEFLHGLSR